jgi:PhnB protein
MQIVTSLSFKGECREAFEFYKSVLGGEITAYPFGEGPPDMPIDAKYKDWLMHAWLQLDGAAIMGADIPPEFGPNIDKPKNGFDVTFHSKDIEECRRVFDALSVGGKVQMAFGETFWSPGYGNFTDKFGIPWMINAIPADDWMPAHMRGEAW